jgi:hypothetical protein
MADSAEKKPLSTTPADLAVAVDAVLARTFGGLDLADEARKLGLPVEVLARLRDGLVELRDLAAHLAAEMAPKAGGTEGQSPS